ncbi:hypothetical protein CEXT_362611 [Caerostris extrusa]|uniref:Uncharacterized protein n=1 Tax=Caerostris extrusa TaxID=172846 RepID=A0AAV4W1E6_CAEEX|nr:hypothetical protein CEXT_362611 [Caerostris extrusa]
MGVVGDKSYQAERATANPKCFDACAFCAFLSTPAMRIPLKLHERFMCEILMSNSSVQASTVCPLIIENMLRRDSGTLMMRMITVSLPLRVR